MTKRLFLAAVLALATFGAAPALAERLELVVKDAAASFGSDSDPVVNIRLDEPSGAAFARFTHEHAGKVSDLYVDDEIVASPMIHTAILGGSIQIGGGLDVEAATELAVRLRSGEASISIAPRH